MLDGLFVERMSRRRSVVFTYPQFLQKKKKTDKKYKNRFNHNRLEKRIALRSKP